MFRLLLCTLIVSTTALSGAVPQGQPWIDVEDAKGSAVPARLMRYDAWIAIVRSPSRSPKPTNSGASRDGSGRRRQAVGLSLKIWSARAPIWRERRAARSRPFPTPRWRPTAGASSGHVRRRRGSGRDRARATVPVMDDEVREAGPEPDEGLDLLTIGLFVFFVALIGTVGALLLVQVFF